MHMHMRKLEDNLLHWSSLEAGSDLVVTAENSLGGPRASGECPSSLLLRSNSLERGFGSSLVLRTEFVSCASRRGSAYGGPSPVSFRGMGTVTGDLNPRAWAGVTRIQL